MRLVHRGGLEPSPNICSDTETEDTTHALSGYESSQNNELSGVSRLNSKAGPRMASVNKKETGLSFIVTRQCGEMGVPGCGLKLLWFVLS